MSEAWESMVRNETVANDGPSQTATILGAAVMLLFFVEGVIGNLWILLAVLSRRSVWNIINLFIASLCFNELLTAGLIVVLIIDSYIWQHWTTGELMCKLNPEFTVAFTGCSLWHTAFIAIHRYIVVCHNDVYKQMSKTAYVTVVLVFTRLIPFACTFPGFSLQTSGYVPKLLRCILLPDQGIRIMTFTLVQIVLPCVIVILCYLLVFFYVVKMGRQVTNSNMIQQRELKITKMFGMIFVMILIGFVPYAAVRNADKSNQLSADIYVIVTVFYGIATCSSPLIYGAMSTDIRRVCMSCVSQCFCLRGACERLRHNDRMLSLSQMADADVSPESNCRNVQLKDAGTQIENGGGGGGGGKVLAGLRDEKEPLYQKARCFSIEEEDDEATPLHTLQDTTKTDNATQITNSCNKNNNLNCKDCHIQEKEKKTQSDSQAQGSKPESVLQEGNDCCTHDTCSKCHQTNATESKTPTTDL